jgi:hypothetical protein
LVLAPSLCGTAARAGYVSSDRIYADSAAYEDEGFLTFGLLRERPPLVVAGSSETVQEQGPDASDQSIPRAVKDRLSASLLCPSSGRTAPVTPGARKLASTFDADFHADSSAQRRAAARLATYENRVLIYHPCCDRLFRPPRQVGC